MRNNIQRRTSLLLTIAMCGLIAVACSDTSSQASAPAGNASAAAAAPAGAASAAPAPAPTDVRVPAGTRLVVRMIDSVNSKTDHVGDTFTASLEQPLDVNRSSSREG